MLKATGTGGHIRRCGGAALALLCLALLPLRDALAEPVSQEGRPFETLEQERRASGGEADQAPLNVPYEVTIQGLEDRSNLEDIVTRISQLLELQDRPPATLAGLRRRAEGDVEKFRTALNSEGFYNPTIELDIREDRQPVEVQVTIDPGQVYKLQSFDIEYVGTPVSEEEDIPLTPGELDIVLGSPARAPEIVAAERDLLRALKEQAHPLPVIENREAVVDHADKTMAVTLKVDAGPKAVFGETTFDGLEDVERDYVEGIIPWQQGEPYDIRKLEEARLALSGTALFDSLIFQTPDSVTDEGRLPVTVRVVEGPPRSIGGGLSYSTDLGPGANAFWEHRNLLGRNEKLRVSGKFALYEQRADVDFRKPRFLRPDQSLISTFSLLSSQTDAFDEDSAKAFVGLERTFEPYWTGSLGASAEFSRLTDEEGQRDFLIYGLPVSATRDTSDNVLNPTEGTKLTLSSTPYFGTIERNVLWLTNEASGSAYYALDEAANFVLAARGRVGSIIGEEAAILPANKRFYSGGGGSVRGYEFRSIGPENEDGDPSGGRSVVEVGAELRWRFMEDFGLVPFIDGGMVSEKPWPDFEEEFLWAAGLGLRYYTAVGPLRLDLAFPLNGREGDDIFQFYISLGQAF